MNRTDPLTMLALAPWLRVWAERRRGRRALVRMDDRALRDLAVSRVDAWREARKPFWRA